MKFLLSTKFYLPIIFIFLGMFIYFIIDRFVLKTIKGNYKTINAKKKNTVIILTKNIIKYLISVIVLIAILNVYKIDTDRILAAVGLASVFIGLAFQDVLKDFLAGFSIIFDNLYIIGDNVDINGFKGNVIEIGLKTTKIRSYTGEIKMINNHVITEITNYSLNNIKLMIDLYIDNECLLSHVEQVLKDIKDDIKDIKNVNGAVELLGIEKIVKDAYVYRITVECLPMTQPLVKREALKEIKINFDREKIKFYTAE